MDSKLYVLCTGLKEGVGKVVIDGLQPEVEVIHFTLAAQIESELPLLLQNKIPSNPSSTIGSGNWEKPPVALLLGGAYDEEMTEQLRKLVYDVPGTRHIPWLRVDLNRKAAPSHESQIEDYGKSVVRRMKEQLNKLNGEGKLNENDGGVYLV